MFFLRVVLILIGFVQFSIATKSKKIVKEKNIEKIDIFESDLKSLGKEYFYEKKKNDGKIYLKDLLENKNWSNTDTFFNEIIINSDLLPKEICKVKTIEVSHKVGKCGRITMNTTSCEGSCKSSSNFVKSMNHQKIKCYTCKASEFEHVKHKVKCANGVPTFLLVKSVKSCSCFKNSEHIIPVKLVYQKKN